MPPIDCPFRGVEAVLSELQRRTPIIFVDFHAEATSEKVAMGWFLNGKVSAVFGTHTHVQTADERILPDGTAYITDVGMTGPHDSVIGMDVEGSIQRFLFHLPSKFTPETRGHRLNALVVEVNPETGRATGVERLNLPLPS
jgi:metallophosphoesterase (TIGR00282 family)